MDISIVIPSFNTVELTTACLRDLLAQPPRRPHEIIVVDNGSSDGTAETIRRDFGNISLIANPGNWGFSKACNLGARETSGRYICFLNSDTVQGGRAMDDLAAWLENHPKTGIVGPELYSSAKHPGQMSWQWYPLLAGEIWARLLAPHSIRDSPLKNYLVTVLQRKSRPVPMVTGASLMIRREVFARLHGFDENFELYFEDGDLCRRCRQAGWEVDFVKTAKVIHQVGQSSLASWKLISLVYQQSHIAYYRKHASPLSVQLLKCYLYLKWLCRCIRAKHESGDPTKSAYCRAYRKVIREEGRITLAGGIAQYLGT